MVEEKNKGDIFSKWINKKFIEWCGDSRKTLSEFASYIGVSQSLMSHWMTKNGKAPREHTTIVKLVNKYGNEVYDILGIPAPISEASYGSFPPPIRELFKSAEVEINSIYAREKVPADSPEAVRIAEEVFSKYGITINSVEQLDDE